ncbi:hypothetical protein H4R20_002335 [Coemansia guatemalensis]|uniref:Galactose-binding like protein n=1 Tax=Coemansia guatemalensis TaxID=2761395 RepID=A0A9W8I413_9FUNG|nr:hypothetical protein H4R20_002335 [Coemansia guatemalensis]
MASASLKEQISNWRVSSVLNRDTSSFGKQYLLDGSHETCWNSEQGTPQHILVEFKVPVLVDKVSIQFQGGFAGKATKLIDLGRKADICPLYPEDNNKLQTFVLPKHEQCVDRRRIKIQFLTSTDFYGRIIVYSLDVHGRVAEHSETTLEQSRQQDPAGATLESASADISGTVIKIE